MTHCNNVLYWSPDFIGNAMFIAEAHMPQLFISYAHEDKSDALLRFQALACPENTADWTNKLRTAIFGVTQRAVSDDVYLRGTIGG